MTVLAGLIACAAVLPATAAASTETITLVSEAGNSLCVNPTHGFEPLTSSGELNLAPLTTASTSGAFPDTGAACELGTPSHAIAMGGPGKAVYPYSGEIPGASWVSYNSAGEDGSNPPPKYYIYDATFRLCSNQVSGASLEGKMFADNVAGAFLNGQPVGHQERDGQGDFDKEHAPAGDTGGWPFGPGTGAFQAGLNTLQLVVLDESPANTAVDFSALINVPARQEPCEEPEEPKQAEAPHWLSNGKPIPPGQAEPVQTSGTITLHYLETTITCKLKDEETIVNPAGGGAGTDELTEFTLSGCKAKPSPCPKGTTLEVASIGLPWATKLLPGPPITDEITGIHLEVRCSGKFVQALTGSLTPTVGNSVLEFGSGSGTLEDSSGTLATVTGTDSLKGPKGDQKITAKTEPIGPPPPHWYSDGKLIPEGEAVSVATSGTLTSRSGETTVTCKVKDEEVVENPAGGGAGVDELRALVLSGCKATHSQCPTKTKEEIIPQNLPWLTHLIAGPPVRDVIEGVDFEVACSGSVIATFTGTLMPTVGNSTLEFGEGAGALEGPGGVADVISGTDKLTGPMGDTKITAH